MAESTGVMAVEDATVDMRIQGASDTSDHIERSGGPGGQQMPTSSWSVAPIGSSLLGSLLPNVQEIVVANYASSGREGGTDEDRLIHRLKGDGARRNSRSEIRLAAHDA